jgi:hypothetical protein
MFDAAKRFFEICISDQSFLWMKLYMLTLMFYRYPAKMID